MKNTTCIQHRNIVIQELSNHYKVESFLHFSNPWELLVATLLSAQCTDIRVNKVTPALFSFLPTPEKASKVLPEEIEPFIQSVNYYHTKAKHIHMDGTSIVQNFNGEVPNDMTKLLQLKGIGRKTANVILAQAFNINQGIAVDTHVMRVSYRLGWTSELKNPHKTECELMKLFPSKEWESVSILLIHLGRAICKARKPLCEICYVRDFCKFSSLS